jgi:preprotein translocase subunit SecA
LIISGPSTVSTHQYDRWKPLVEQLVRKQNMLCNRLASEAKEVFEKAEADPKNRDELAAQGGLLLFKVKLGSRATNSYSG